MRPEGDGQGFDQRWVAAAIVVGLGLAIVSGSSPVADESVFRSTDEHLEFGVVVLALSFVAFLTTPAELRWNGVLRGIAIGFPIAIAIFLCPPGIGGRGDFQFRTLVLLGTLALVLTVLRTPGQSFRAQFFGAVLGIALPPALIFGLLFVSCGNGGCFS